MQLDKMHFRPLIGVIEGVNKNKSILSYLQLLNSNLLARQLNTKLTGTKGNLSFYKMHDEYFVRLKSQGGKQTQRTKARQKDFAIAASLSKNIRLMLHTAIPNPKQKAMQNRLTKALLQWQLSRAAQQTGSVIEQLDNFQFIEDVSFQTIFNIPIIINKTTEDCLQIIIPAFKPKHTIKAPGQTKQIQINIAAGRCSITQHKQINRIDKQLIITYNSKPLKQQIISLPLKPLQQSITVVAVSLGYWVKQQNSAVLLKVKQKAWSPAAIIYAVEN
jgi:hypothetical protein